jgi:hypothetical protein
VNRVPAGLAALALMLVHVTSVPALGQQRDAIGAAPRPAPPARPGRVIQDPRLNADSTLFPYEWPTLNDLLRELVQTRPAVEAGEVEALLPATADIRKRANALFIDSVPALLAPRRQELRGRMIALRSALDLLDSLAIAAREAPPRPDRGELLGLVQLDPLGAAETMTDVGDPALPRPPPAPSDTVGATRAPPGEASEVRRTRPGPVAGADSAARSQADAPAAADADSPAFADIDSAVVAGADSLGLYSVDPVEAYLDGWRDVYRHAEAIVHVLRNPSGAI